MPEHKTEVIPWTGPLPVPRDSPPRTLGDAIDEALSGMESTSSRKGSRSAVRPRSPAITGVAAVASHPCPQPAASDIRAERFSCEINAPARRFEYDLCALVKIRGIRTD